MSKSIKVSDHEWQKQKRKNRFKNKKRDERKVNVDKFRRKHYNQNNQYDDDDDWYSSLGGQDDEGISR